MDNGHGSGYVLYYHQYSICSLMVLYTLTLKGDAKDAKDAINVQTKTVDIFHEEQLEESFLCNINDHGQVRHTLFSLAETLLLTTKPRCQYLRTTVSWKDRSPTVWRSHFGWRQNIRS